MTTVEKTLPFNEDAERAVLGSLVIDFSAIAEVSTIIQPQDFYGDARRRIYEAILRLYQKREPVDFITLQTELESQPGEFAQNKNGLEDVGGASAIMALIGYVPTSGNADHYARIVARLAVRREIIRVASKMAQMAFDPEQEDLLPTCEAMVLAIGKQHSTRNFVSFSEYLPVYVDKLEARQNGKSKVRGVSTGMRSLDGLLGGLQAGKLYIPAARPGVGKTTICQNIAYRGALKHGYRVGFFTLEMSKDDLMDRFMSMHTKINSLSLQNGHLTEENWQTIVQAEDELKDLGIYFEYTPGIFLDELASMARRLVQQHQISVLMIDYLQLIRARIDGKRIQMREMEVAEIARGLKALAGELGIPIMAPAQINRQVERSGLLKDEDTGLSYKMPMLSDLRESGEIEQSADVVFFLARAEGDDTKVKLNIAKNRSGPTGDVDLYFEATTTRFLPLGTNMDEFGNVSEL